MKVQIPLGHDIPLNFTLKSSDGTIITPNSLSGIVIILYYAISGQVLDKFSKTTQSGYGSITVVDNALGKISVVVPATKTKVSQEGKVLCEIKLKALDSSMADGDFENGQAGVEVFELIKSRIANVTY